MASRPGTLRIVKHSSRRRETSKVGHSWLLGLQSQMYTSLYEFRSRQYAKVLALQLQGPSRLAWSFEVIAPPPASNPGLRDIPESKSHQQALGVCLCIQPRHFTYGLTLFSLATVKSFPSVKNSSSALGRSQGCADASLLSLLLASQESRAQRFLQVN